MAGPQHTEHLVVFGATGRVGGQVVAQALAAGHQVTAVARTPSKITVGHDRLHVVQGDTLDPGSVLAALEGAGPATAVVMAVGADPLRPSTVVTQSVRSITAAMARTGPRRYLGVSGTAQMPATFAGRVTQTMVRRFIKAAADHQGAYDIVTATDLDYVLAACPYIKDGPHTGRYTIEPGRFPGGYRTISPADVADFLLAEVRAERFHRRIVGIWN